MLDDRDILLTRWCRVTDQPMLRDDCTFGNIWYDPDNSLYRLFYHADAESGNGTVEQVTSVNGRVFGTPVTALGHGAGGTWDDYSTGVPFAWYETGETRPWRMLYRGNADDAAQTYIGLATSTDGTTWERKDTAGNALNAAVLSGTGEAWDDGSIDCSGLIKVGTTYYLYYNTVSNPRQIGLATSTDLKTWTKHESNPLFKGSADPDVDPEPETDNDKGRFCPDIVRWDDKVGTTRYVMFLPHYTGTHTKPEIEVYTCASPTFTRSARSYVGKAFETDVSPTEKLEGRDIDGSGCDTPAIITDDITRNVATSTQTGPQVVMLMALYSTTYGWNQGLFVHNPTLAGAELSDVVADLPVTAPRYKLDPNGDANTVALWLPGSTGSLFDLSGNDFHLYSKADYIDSNGAYFDRAKLNFLRRSPGANMAALNSVTGDFAIEFRASLDTALGSGSFGAIFWYGSGTAHKHFYLYLNGDDGGDYSWAFYFSDANGDNVLATSSTFTWTLGVYHRWLVCRGGTDIHFFKDGTLVNTVADKGDTIRTSEASNYIIVGATYADPTPAAHFWDGHIDELRVSDTARHTSNYTAAALTHQYASSGTIFGPVIDLGRAGLKPSLSPVFDSLPTDTSVTLKARAAANATDQSTTIGDFAAFPNTRPAGQYIQFAATLATSDTTVSPVVQSLLGHGR